MTTAVSSRRYRFEDDFWKVRNLLVETYPITGPGFNWEIRRWDGSHFHDTDPAASAAWRARVRVWETPDGHIVGAAHTESQHGDPHLQIHPDYRQLLEAEMIAWAEDNLAITNAEGRQQLEFYVYDYDAPRIRLLTERGYRQEGWGGVQRRMFISRLPLPERPLAEGYTLGTVGPQDGDRMAALLNAAFNRDFHTGADFASFAAQAPSFREDLHLVAEAPDGTLAAHVGVIVDEANRRALYEPVCTHPDHRQKGLAQSLMFEGLRRAKVLVAREITVDTGITEPANRLYESIGFSEAYKGFIWRKVW